MQFPHFKEEEKKHSVLNDLYSQSLLAVILVLEPKSNVLSLSLVLFSL